MAHFNFVISQNAKWGHAGFYIDCHRMTVPENILLQKSTDSIYRVQSFREFVNKISPRSTSVENKARSQHHGGRSHPRVDQRSAQPSKYIE